MTKLYVYGKGAGKSQEDPMSTMSDNKRRKIQARQRKVKNAAKRVSKLEKRDRNA